MVRSAIAADHDGGVLALCRPSRPRRGHQCLQRWPRADLSGFRLLVRPTARHAFSPTRRLNVGVADDFDRERSGLQVIKPAPYNAEAPPEALTGDITPTAMHYVRSNFAVPEHDGTLTVDGAVENPMNLTLDGLRALTPHERVVTLECAGNGRLEMRPLPTGEPWGGYAVSTARWTGALLHDVLNQANPAAEAVAVLFQGSDHGFYHSEPVLAGTNRDDLIFERA